MKKNIIIPCLILLCNLSLTKAQTNHEEILPPAEKVEKTSNEQMPVFPGGDKALFKFLQHNIEYPKEAKKLKLSGKVYVKFVIDTAGAVTQVELAKGITGGEMLNNEAIRVIKLLPNWTPGYQDGKPRAVAFTMPIAFKY